MFKVKVSAFMVKKENPMPMRTMFFDKVVKETNKSIFVKLQGWPLPSSECLHCGKKLTHPISLLYGIGPICGQHFYINPLGSQEELDAAIEELRDKMSQVKWEGWIPKSKIVNIEELPKTHDVVFKYGSKEYHTITDECNLYNIKRNATIISVSELIFGKVV